MSLVSSPALRPLFTWPQRYKSSLALPGFVLLALGLHGLGFYLFQVVYPPNITRVPPSAKVTILNPAIPAHRELLAWVDAEDPALLSGHLKRAVPGEAALLPLAYQPTFSRVEAGLAALPDSETAMELPSFLPAAPVNPHREPSASKISPAHQTSSVSLDLEDSLPFHLPESFPDFAPEDISTTAKLEPVRFLMAVTPGGIIRHAFVQHSSGNPNFDTAAAHFLRAVRLTPEKNMREIQWGIGVFQWTKGAE